MELNYKRPDVLQHHLFRVFFIEIFFHGRKTNNSIQSRIIPGESVTYLIKRGLIIFFCERDGFFDIFVNYLAPPDFLSKFHLLTSCVTHTA